LDNKKINRVIKFSLENNKDPHLFSITQSSQHVIYSFEGKNIKTFDPQTFEHVSSRHNFQYKGKRRFLRSIFHLFKKKTSRYLQ